MWSPLSGSHSLSVEPASLESSIERPAPVYSMAWSVATAGRSGGQQTHSMPSSFEGQGAGILIDAHHHHDDGEEVKEKPRYKRSHSVQLVASEPKPPRFAMASLPGHGDDVIAVPVRSSQVG